ncbi:MAG: DUF3047 domain-containing protein [Alphaproteobacteria bacterium]
MATNVDSTLLAEGWSEVTFDGKAPNRFTPSPSDGVVVESDDSVSLLQRDVEVDLDRTPCLTWRWQVSEPAPPSDLTVRGEDDRSLALYVAFPFDAEHATAFEHMQRAVVEKLAGKEAPGRVLMYVWGGDGARGDRVESPHLGESGMMTILRPARTETGIWFEETVDVAEDYRRIFESEPPDPITIAIGADTDDTQSMAKGAVADMAFVSKSDAKRSPPG